MARDASKTKKKERVPSPTYEEQIAERVHQRLLPHTDNIPRKDDSTTDTGEEPSDPAGKTGEGLDDDKSIFNTEDEEDKEEDNVPVHMVRMRPEPPTPAEIELMEM